MADTSDFITGCDGSEIGDCEEPWCLDDGPPPGYISVDCGEGYELVCTEITSYPVLPPTPISCSRGSYYSWMRPVRKYHNNECMTDMGGTNGVGYNIYNEEGTYLWTWGDAYGGTFNNCHFLGNDAEHMYMMSQASNGGIAKRFFKRNINTLVEESWYQDGVQWYVSHWNRGFAINGSLIGITSGEFRIGVGAPTYGGIVILNTVFEYYAHCSISVHMWLINGVIWGIDAGVLKIYLVTPGVITDSSLTLASPPNTAGFGYEIMDLGVYDEVGIVAVKGTECVHFYDYEYNYLGTATSPAPAGKFGGDGEFNNSMSGIARYGTLIAITETESSWSAANTGAVHFFRTNGQYVGTFENINNPIGAGGRHSSVYYGGNFIQTRGYQNDQDSENKDRKCVFI